MAEIQEKDDGGGKKKGGSKQKKANIHVDFTPMVDMNMLLITFFMLCTSLSKPQTMEISMPSNDKVTEDNQTKIKASQAVTILLGGDDRVYYYMGEPNYEDYNSLVETTYDADGLRDVLLNKNKELVAIIKNLKIQKQNHEISDKEYDKKVAEAKKESKSSPTVIIKADNKANYKNLVDALDEMQICNISKYAIVDITEGDEFLLKNLEHKGQLTENIDRSGTTPKQ